MKYVEKITPDFPSQYSKFLRAACTRWHLGSVVGDGVPVTGVRVRIWSGAGEEQGTSWRVFRRFDGCMPPGWEEATVTRAVADGN